MKNNDEGHVDVVFVSNLTSNHDYTKAASYGALRPITSGRYPIFKVAELQEEIVRALAVSRETDYLLISGSSIVAALCLAAWLIAHKQCKLLLYDQAKGVYTTRVVSRDEIHRALETTRGEINAEAPAA